MNNDPNLYLLLTRLSERTASYYATFLTQKTSLELLNGRHEEVNVISGSLNPMNMNPPPPAEAIGSLYNEWSIISRFEVAHDLTAPLGHHVFYRVNFSDGSYRIIDPTIRQFFPVCTQFANNPALPYQDRVKYATIANTITQVIGGIGYYDETKVSPNAFLRANLYN
eukprot:TRINITY_DN5614_c0_g1_i1.p1 TRINITY_DN5614_c0_g1~~TRINITY_DN5614_c0_g1_i1.p1  ORF type:complete len:167 (-),score=14.88 TRINITY_DN5614_c0_g1_i1:81-581(-)